MTHMEELYRILRNSHVQAQGIVDTVSEPLLVLDEALRVQTANRAFFETFQVDLYNTERVLDEDTKRRLRERDIICVGESGIFTPEDVKVVQDAGCRSVLVGESLVKEEDIEGAVKKLLS